jgi:hypothetical protein
VLTPDPEDAPMTPTHPGSIRLALVTDAWLPQVNGVTTTLGRCVDEIRAMGDTVEVIHPGLFRTVPCPRYSEIRLAAMPVPGVGRRLRAFEPNAIHIATEGPLGMAARGYCRRRRTPVLDLLPHQISRVPAGLRQAADAHRLRDHALVPPSRAVHARADAYGERDELVERGFDHVVTWTRGVDAELFTPER